MISRRSITRIYDVLYKSFHGDEADAILIITIYGKFKRINSPRKIVYYGY